MRLGTVTLAAALALLALAGGTAVACPLSESGSSPCSKLGKEQYMTSRIYVRSVAARPPAFDEAKLKKFVTAAMWTPLKGDLERRTRRIVWRKGKDVSAPALRFIDATTVTTTPAARKGIQNVLVRQIVEDDLGTLLSVDDDVYVILECKNGKRTTSCLMRRSDLERESKLRALPSTL